MKKAKRLSSFLLSAAMVLSMGMTSLAALPSDVVNSPHEEAIETLGALNIMVGDKESGMFRPDDTIRRSEFAKVAVLAMGLEDAANASNQPTKFPDVVADHWANGYINVANQQGMVIGDDEGNFRPDDTISYAEAMTVLVRAIGHEPVAETKGGFPTGYIVVGSQNGIAKNATAAADDAVKRGMVAQMTFNSLDVKMMEQTGYGNDAQYEVVDKTLLSDRLDVTKGYGQITATSSTAIGGNSSLNDDEVKIGDEVFMLAETSYAEAANNLLGFNVVYYVREEANGDKTLLLARAESGKNKSVEVTAENIEEITGGEDDNGYTLAYWIDKETDKKPTEVDIAKDAKFIFNGKAEAIESIDAMKPEAGHIRLLDSDRDDNYDIVFITSYENYVVEEVNVNSNRITDKYGNPSLLLDPKDKNLKFNIYRAGVKIDISDLNEWDVLSVAKSKDGKLITIEAVTNSVEGKISEISGEKYYINGEEYKKAANLTEDLKLDDEGTFYLDVEGKIAAVDTHSARSSNYAYLANATLKTGIDNNLEVKLFTKEGESKVVQSGDKLKVNGKNNQTPEQAIDAFKVDGDVKAQLITYEVNSKGELTQLNSAKATNGKVDKDNFSMNVEGSMQYKSASKKLVGENGANVNVNDKTIVFNVPAGKTSTDDYSIETISLFENDNSYDVQVFDMGEDLTAKVVLVTSSTGTANAETSIAVVDKVTTVNNEDGIVVDKLYAYQDGKEVSFLASEEGVLVKAETTRDAKKLARGDVIQIKLNAKGEIDNFRLLFDSDNMEEEFRSTPAEDLEVVYGRVEKKFAGSINVAVNDEAVQNYNISGVTVYQFDSKKNDKAITVAEPGDIAKYDEADPSRVLIRIYKDEVKEIVIVK